MTQTAQTAHLDFLGSQTRLDPLASWALYAAVVFTRWSTLRRTRRTLKQLEPSQLRDIGIGPEAARNEARRFFWMG